MVAEARSADEPLLTRRCVIMKAQDFTTDKYLRAQKQHAAAVLILLPQNISSVPLDTIKVVQGLAIIVPEGPHWVLDLDEETSQNDSGNKPPK